MAKNTAKWHKNNPGRTAQRTADYKALKKAAGKEITDIEKRQIAALQLRRCYYCGIPLAKVAVDADHRIPLSRKGKNNKENMVLACRTCNRDKRSKTDVEFFDWRRRHGLPIFNRDQFLADRKSESDRKRLEFEKQQEERKPQIPDGIEMLLPIGKIGISNNCAAILNSNGIRTLGELIQRTEAELLRMKLLGRKGLNEIKLKLEQQTVVPRHLELGCRLIRTEE